MLFMSIFILCGCVLCLLMMSCSESHLLHRNLSILENFLFGQEMRFNAGRPVNDEQSNKVKIKRQERNNFFMYAYLPVLIAIIHCTS